VEDLFGHYKDVIAGVVGPSLYDEEYHQFKKPIEWKSSHKYASQITYMYDQFTKKNPDDKIHKCELPEHSCSDVKQFHETFIEKLKERYSSDEEVEVYYLYVAREKAAKEDEQCKFSVRVEDKRSKKTVTIYSHEDNIPNEDNIDLLEDRWKASEENQEDEVSEKGGNQEKITINKQEAWKHLKIMIDAVYHYSEDFNKKKEYLEIKK
jgi:hypothetical protein